MLAVSAAADRLEDGVTRRSRGWTLPAPHSPRFWLGRVRRWPPVKAEPGAELVSHWMLVP